MPNSRDFMDALAEPPTTSPSGLTVGLSAQQRLDLAMRRANEQNPADIPDPVQWSRSTTGVPNPYGRGLAAFEPNNVLFDAYATAKGDYDQHKAAEAALATSTTTTGSAAPGGSPLIKGDGMVTKMVNAALALAQRRVPYVWGGTTSNGVDCSGLIYYAAAAAGLDVKRWRAVDYGRMGQAVTLAEARAGDIIYYDEPGSTDHVGIYLGNGKMVQAPQSGDVVKVSNVGKPTSIRRIFDDSAFGTIATPSGGTATSYGGRAYQPNVGVYQPGLGSPVNTAAAHLGSAIARIATPTTPGSFGNRTPF